ncbi:NADPH--cytochrome P450 reductase [Trichinella spiralis]|uniref:NADPH--cytochrome P450 reductase n=1 Tax=Trichinella spiralis TaxID=6334 RepID=UPI0001EFC8BB|nr:NADPH--cytochrome P450 reductase [Trichinella spiralis]
MEFHLNKICLIAFAFCALLDRIFNVVIITVLFYDFSYTLVTVQVYFVALIAELFQLKLRNDESEMQIFDGSKNRHLIFSAVAFLISRYVEMHAMEDSHLSTVFDGYLDLISYFIFRIFISNDNVMKRKLLYLFAIIIVTVIFVIFIDSAAVAYFFVPSFLLRSLATVSFCSTLHWLPKDVCNLISVRCGVVCKICIYTLLCSCIFDLYFFEHFRALFSFFLFQHGTVFTVMFTLSITFGTIYTAAFISIAADRPAMVLIMNYAAKLVVSISESIFFGLHNETKISSLLLIGWLFQVAVTYRGHAVM